jgi:hypothetical protein
MGYSRPGMSEACRCLGLGLGSRPQQSAFFSDTAASVETVQTVRKGLDIIDHREKPATPLNIVSYQ